MFESSHNLKIWAKVMAAMARIEAMKCMNQHREQHGLSQAYDEGAFHDIASDIERLSESFE